MLIRNKAGVDRREGGMCDQGVGSPLHMITIACFSSLSHMASPDI